MLLLLILIMIAHLLLITSPVPFCIERWALDVGRWALFAIGRTSPRSPLSSSGNNVGFSIPIS
jgi:hypothetical protein